MAKRMGIGIILMLFTVSLLFGCREGETSSMGHNNNSFSEESSVNGTEESNLPVEVDKQTDYKQLITRRYSLEELGAKSWLVQFGTSYVLTMESVNENFPIECLRQMEDGRYYAVYMLEDGGLFYVFFYHDGFMYTYSHSIYWVPTVNPVGYSRLKGYLDLDTVKKYDEAIALLPEKNLLNCLAPGPNEMQTLHYTKDGLISIDYVDEGDGIHLTASGPQLHSDYILEYKGHLLDFSVLEQDLPVW